MLEIIVATPDEARLAEQGGADRLELVSALAEGGLTPGIGLAAQVVRAVRLPVNVMVRPHSRGFQYCETELQVMEAEIRALREAGANGVVLGVLDGARRPHLGHLGRLLACAQGLEVTFHRAVDEAEDPVAAAAALARVPGIRNLLTSGGPGPIADHVEILARMRRAAGPVRVMAGGGLTPENSRRILGEAGLGDAHYGTAVRKGRAVDGDLDPAVIRGLRRLLDELGR